MANAGITQKLQALGMYRLTSLLSFNGVVATFQGFDQNNNLPAAVVAVPESSLGNPAAWAKFAAEFKPMMTAGASRVCQPQNLGHDYGHYWASYEWLKGAHLGILVRDNGLPEQFQAFEWMSQLCDATGILHARQSVHRIISPASIFINDFSQVKLLHAAWGRILLNTTGGLLNPAFASILPFASPEVVSGKEGEEASDVYSIGANLFFLLTGQPVFWHDTPGTLADLIRTQPVDMSPLQGATIPEAVELLEEMLSHDPQDRPVNMPALRDRLLSLGQLIQYYAAQDTQAPVGIPQDQVEPPQYAAPGSVSSQSVPVQPVPKPALEESGYGMPPRFSTPEQQVPPEQQQESSAADQYSPEAGEQEGVDEDSALSQMLQRQRAQITAQQAAAAPPPPLPIVQTPRKESKKTMLILLAAIVIVLVIAGGIGAIFVLPKLMGSAKEKVKPPEPKHAVSAEIYSHYEEARQDLRVLGQWNQAYYRANGRWPLKADELQSVGAKPEELKDPWDRVVDVRGSFVISYGKDGIADNGDDIWYDCDRRVVDGYMPEAPADAQ